MRNVDSSLDIWDNFMNALHALARFSKVHVTFVTYLFSKSAQNLVNFSVKSLNLIYQTQLEEES